MFDEIMGIIKNYSDAEYLRNSNEINLTTKEFEIFYLLVVNRGRVLTYDQIYHKVWNEYTIGQAVADAVAENDASTELTTTKEPEKAGRGGKTAAKNTGKKDAKAAKQEPEEKPLTLEEVRAVLAEKSREGHTAEVKELLNKHGADKLSEIDPAEYPALLADAEVL